MIHLDTEGDRAVRNATLILLTLNELPGLYALFDRLPLDRLQGCTAVDGGSKDGSLEFLEARNIPIIHQAQPGWGEAVRAGAESVETESMVFFSPDGNQNPEDILRLVDMLQEGYDMVIASRFTKSSVHEDDGGFLRMRARVAQWFTELSNRRHARGYRLTDATNSFRAVTTQAMGKLELEATGFELAYQMTMRGQRQGMRIGEIPTFEGPRLVAREGSRSLTVGLHHLQAYWQERWR